jgi:hypothetical protein
MAAKLFIFMTLRSASLEKKQLAAAGIGPSRKLTAIRIAN